MGTAKRHTPELFLNLNLLRQIAAAVANRKTHPVACWKAGITEQTCYRWRITANSTRDFYL